MGTVIEDEAVEDFWALRDINFEVNEGEVIGIIGKNGAGKSTLLKILSRITDPSEGRIEMNGRVSSLLEVGTGFNPELTGRENIFLNGAILGMSRREIQSKFDAIVAFAEVEQFLDTPVKRYSSGMYVRLAFAVASHLEPEILIVDEVLAVGDAEFQRKCLGKMEDISKGGRTVLFVSHNMVAINHICQKAILLSGGRVVAYADTHTVVDEYLTGAVPKNNGVTLPAGFIFYREKESIDADFAISGIQMLDKNEQPMKKLGTWDYVKFRFFYSARKRANRASAELKCKTRDEVPLLLCTTHHQASLIFPIEQGEHYIDCSFPRWPLSEGHYVLGAGLSIPNIEWLCWDEDMCELPVVARDVYKSGVAPTADQYLLATEYQWHLSGI